MLPQTLTAQTRTASCKVIGQGLQVTARYPTLMAGVRTADQPPALLTDLLDINNVADLHGHLAFLDNVVFCKDNVLVHGLHEEDKETKDHFTLCSAFPNQHISSAYRSHYQNHIKKKNGGLKYLLT